MSNDLTVIGATPEETRHRETVDRRPRDLVGKKILSAGKLHELRQTTAITEDVGQPYHLRWLTAQGLKSLLSERKASREGLTARELRIALHIQNAGCFPLPTIHPALDPP